MRQELLKHVLVLVFHVTSIFTHTRQAEACMCVWMNMYILAIVCDVPLKAIAKQKQYIMYFYIPL